MLNQEDIKLLIAAGEGYNTEFKVAVPNKVKELTEEKSVPKETICTFRSHLCADWTQYTETHHRRANA